MADIETYSFSKLNSFHQCPYAWKQRYIEHASQMQNAFAEFGTLCHSLFERYTTGELELSELADTYEWEFDSAFTTNFPKLGKTDLKKSYYNKGLTFFQNWPGYDKQCEFLASEEKFTIQIGDFNLIGFIDFQYVDENGKLICLDYKSHNGFTKEELKSYGRQPYLYSGYMKEKLGRFPDILRFFSFRENKYYDIPFNIEEYNEAVQWAIDTVAEIRGAWQYEKRPDQFYCTKLCSSRGECKYGKYFTWKKK